VSLAPSSALVLSDEGRFYEIEDIFSDQSPNIDCDNSNELTSSSMPLPFVHRWPTNNSSVISSYKFSKMNIQLRRITVSSDELLKRLYRDLRFIESIQPDDKMVAVLKGLFSISQPNQRKGVLIIVIN
jgi:hypothetical protein